ncbi:hypothetical protein THAOC_08201 [Thalassiosira oceanica]|uniref:Uncharacterized protein n=1 Tax=Thalassiosira oceanica TaxID=159749 RepID=K0SVJ5_THAOC|nr:hypothetical protein THAOC_08201 [Thalassiosira oceanica]|eukprot:EJK70443.1 hypothetical protein THAOC_08201 [Thalassiosira oceanica]
MQALQYHSITLLKNSLRSEPFQMPGVTLQSRVSILISGDKLPIFGSTTCPRGAPPSPTMASGRRHAIVDKYMSSSSATFDISGSLNGVDRHTMSYMESTRASVPVAALLCGLVRAHDGRAEGLTFELASSSPDSRRGDEVVFGQTHRPMYALLF